MKITLLSKHFIQSLFALFVFTQASVFAQPAIQWDKTFGGTANDKISKTLQTSDGGYLLAGSSDSPANAVKSGAGKGKTDFWIVKASADGTRQWDKTFGGTSWDALTDVQQTTDGGYILGGRSSSNASVDKSEDCKGNFDYWIIKLDSNGTKQWDRTIGLSDSELLRTVKQMPDGGYILGGTAYILTEEQDGGGEEEYFAAISWALWIVKLDANGTIVWDKIHKLSNQAALTNLELTTDGGYIAGIATGTADQVTTKFAVLKLTAAGDKEWINYYGQDQTFNRLRVVQQTRDSGYILGGWSDSHEGGRPGEGYESADVQIIKVDQDGNWQWSRTIGSNDSETTAYNEDVTSILQSSDGGFVISGFSAGGKGSNKTEDSRGGQDFWVIKLQADGNVLWDKTIGGMGNDFLQSTIQTQDGGYLLGGYSDSPVSGEKTSDSKDDQNEVDFWVVKLASELRVQPGTITHFVVKQEDKKAVLEWTSSAGSAVVDQFEVQQRLDRVTWKKVATVNARQVSDDYTYVHTKPTLGIEVQYRLKITGLDKSIKYSQIRSLSIAQDAPKVVWDKIIGSTNLNYFLFMLHTSDDGYILGGRSIAGIGGDKTEENRGRHDYWIVKVTSDGTRQWDKTYGGSADDLLSSIIQTADGGYLLGGSSYSQAGGDKTENSKSVDHIGYLPYDYWVVKITSDGTKQWDRTIGGENGDELRSLYQTPNGDYLLEGLSDSKASGDKSQDAIYGHNDVWEVRLDTEGNKIADKNIFSFDYDTNNRLLRTSDNGYFIYSNDYTNDINSAHIFSKFAKNGSLEWAKTISLPAGSNSLVSFQQTSDQGYLLAWNSSADATDIKSENSRGNIDYWLLKLSPNGVKEWDKTLGGNQNDLLFTVKQMPDGGYILGGQSISSLGWDKTEDLRRNDYDAWIVKLTEKGAKEWDKTIGGSSSDKLYFIHPTMDGGYTFGGITSSQVGADRISPLFGTQDFWIVKLGFETPPLPVTLTSFSAEKEKNTALLTWTTGTETRSDHFELQHSTNGKSWNTLAKVNARGESQDSVGYRYIHVNPVLGAENLYRLKMVDTDESYTFSRIESVTIDAAAALTLFPNPVSETLTIQITDPQNVKNIQLLNSNSVPVYNSGSNPAFQMNVSKLQSGLYFVKITRTDGTFVIQKVVIAK